MSVDTGPTPTQCEVCPPEANCPGPQPKLIPDDPHFDATDGAHPAWWRGHDHTVTVLCRIFDEIISDPMRMMRQGGVCARPLHETKVRIATLAINVGCLRAELAEARRELATAQKSWDYQTTNGHRLEAQLAEMRIELEKAKRALAVFAERERREGRT
jgi:hypothetical protein